VPSEPFPHLDGYGAATVTRIGTRRSWRSGPYLYVSTSVCCRNVASLSAPATGLKTL
jgi:hypothetical protein